MILSVLFHGSVNPHKQWQIGQQYFQGEAWIGLTMCPQDWPHGTRKAVDSWSPVLLLVFLVVVNQTTGATCDKAWRGDEQEQKEAHRR